MGNMVLKEDVFYNDFEEDKDICLNNDLKGNWKAASTLSNWT